MNEESDQSDHEPRHKEDTQPIKDLDGFTGRAEADG